MGGSRSGGVHVVDADMPPVTAHSTRVPCAAHTALAVCGSPSHVTVVIATIALTPSLESKEGKAVAHAVAELRRHCLVASVRMSAVC